MIIITDIKMMKVEHDTYEIFEKMDHDLVPWGDVKNGEICEASEIKKHIIKGKPFYFQNGSGEPDIIVVGLSPSVERKLGITLDYFDKLKEDKKQAENRSKILEKENSKFKSRIENMSIMKRIFDFVF